MTKTHTTMQNLWLILGTIFMVVALSVSIETSVFWNFILKVSCLAAFFMVCRQIKVDNISEEEL